MSLEVITDLQRWQDMIDDLPDFCGKIYYQPAYYRAFEINGDGRPAALYFTDGDTEIFYPFLLRAIPAQLGGEGYFDMQSAYGYGGPAIFGGTAEAVARFSDEFAEWADRANIVAEFIRFNPLYSSSLLTNIYKLELNRTTVSVDLLDGFESLLAQASAPRQRNYRKALKSGLKFVTLTDYQLFTDMYEEAMHRLAADSYYYFSPQHFAALAGLPQETRSFVGVQDSAGRLLATGMFLFDELSAHYHLGASSEAGREYQPNAFMMFEAAKAAVQADISVLHLGGGLSLAEDDGLFRFKAGFSKHHHQFFIARRIHRAQLYQQISQVWQAKTGQKPGILLHYHEGLEHADV
ncbi:MAG: hypothetical protein A2W80_16405 [Candidatus Riflebacteria bacterium GWC2_50_8]|nr:MAG: hypothetical protein A2W80_16405 [Candidatus Riflebacteria bacterium GWC2_50_8]